MLRCKNVVRSSGKLVSRLSNYHNNFTPRTSVIVITTQYSTRRPGFFSQFIDNVKQDMAKNKDMKENLQKFRQEANKLEKSDALKAAREKFHTVEEEATKSSEVLRGKFEGIKDKVQEAIEEAGKSDIAKKAGEGIGKSAKGVTDTISETGQKLGRTEAFRTISQATAAVKSEINTQGIEGRVYISPVQLRKRIDTDTVMDERIVQPNTEATGVELHKDSKFYQQWQNFKDNNQYVNKVLDWKIKYEESENPVIQASRLLTEKVGDLFGGLFQKTELSSTMTEICKVDPNFQQKQFLKDCENDIIPNILEAMVHGDLEILRDWCYESAYSVIATPLQRARQLGYYLDSKILDIENVDLLLGKVMDQGPVLVITFQSQQIVSLRDSKHNVIEGDPNKVMRVSYVWVLCRDPSELNPKAAWRLLEMSANSTEQLV
ncbi:mitochondrial import inner membrane translocase subunit TIM44 isoform X2 [Arctopsyche grandis]|uniref:mitochondrial import inner membrane translocase subunit TIM44 isoform X2 n=1 Tax=Arctopsyche grandis TaxID=121162 RepID=UPI00406D89B7